MSLRTGVRGARELERGGAGGGSRGASQCLMPLATRRFEAIEASHGQIRAHHGPGLMLLNAGSLQGTLDISSTGASRGQSKGKLSTAGGLRHCLTSLDLEDAWGIDAGRHVRLSSTVCCTVSAGCISSD